jgi:hypothetical protein
MLPLAVQCIGANGLLNTHCSIVDELAVMVRLIFILFPPWSIAVSSGGYVLPSIQYMRGSDRRCPQNMLRIIAACSPVNRGKRVVHQALLHR